jgi:quercetin dioxygenase-like cupin family protein
MPAYSLAESQGHRSTTRVLFLRKDGETIQFLSTSQDTRQQCAEMIFSIPAGRKAPRAHEHLLQKEHVEVLSGSMQLYVRNKREILSSGEARTITKGTPHCFGNASSTEPLIVRVSFEPALNIEWYFTQMACSAIRNGGSWKDIPWQEEAVIHYALRRELRLSRSPWWLQHLCFGSLTLLGKITGAIRNIRPMSLHKAYVK